MIDAGSFTVIRLISGIVILSLLIQIDSEESKPRKSWTAPIALFVYAVTFSFAYLSLETGIGALVLFGVVQITMIVATLIAGERLRPSEWVGVFLAFAGLTYLNLPGVEAPSLLGVLLMSAAGIAWGVYTLLGRGSDAPLRETQINFVRTAPFIAILLAVSLWNASLTLASMTIEGVVLAILSGGLASGIGYAIWYSALSRISSLQAAVVQLSVPLLAAIGGIMLLSESMTWRLGISGLLILGGILIVILGKQRNAPLQSSR